MISLKIIVRNFHEERIYGGAKSFKSGRGGREEGCEFLDGGSLLGLQKLLLNIKPFGRLLEVFCLF